jgi:hypothetical protein
MDVQNTIDNVLAGIPADPTPFERNGIVGYGWRDAAKGLSYLAIAADGHPCAGRLDSALKSVGKRELSAAIAEGLVLRGVPVSPHERFDLSVLFAPPARQPWAGPARDAFRARFLAAIDHEALEALGAYVKHSHADAYGWVALDRDRDRRVRIARRWPWAIAYLLKADFLGIVDDGQPDDEAYVLEALVATSRSMGLPAHAEAARFLLHPSLMGVVLSMTDTLAVVGVASSFPPSWLPAPPKEHTPGLDDIFLKETFAFLTLGRLVRDYAIATRQRTIDCLSLEGEGWCATLRRLVERLGLGWENVGPMNGALVLTNHISDMATSFADQVMETAILLTDDGARPRIDAGGIYRSCTLGGIEWSDKTSSEGYGAVTAAAIRVLARDKSLGGMVELARDWHLGLARISEVTAEAARDVSWPRAFDAFETAEGLTLTCLSTPAELLAEGRAMRNCVVTYLGNCMSRISCIVSVTRGPENVATVEIRSDGVDGLEVAQISGPENSPVDTVTLSAVRDFLADVVSGRRAFLPDAIQSEAIEPMDLSRLEGYLGMFPALVEAWGPFLPRTLRGAGPEAFVAASCYDGALHERRIAWLLKEQGHPRRQAA